MVGSPPTSEMLLTTVLWAIEHYPFYAVDPGSVTPPAKNERSEESELRGKLLQALHGLHRRGDTAGPEGARVRPARVASTRELMYLFPSQAANSAVENIRAAAGAQERAVSAAWKKKLPAEQTAALKAVQPSDFLSSSKDMREQIVSQLQDRMSAEYDTMTGSFKIRIETTAPGFGPEDRNRGAEAAAHLAETVALVYEAYTEWKGRRAIIGEITRLDAEIAGREGARDVLEAKRRTKQRKLEEASVKDDLHEAQSTSQSATQQLGRLTRYLEKLDVHLAKRKQIKGAGKGTIYPRPFTMLSARTISLISSRS